MVLDIGYIIDLAKLPDVRYEIVPSILQSGKQAYTIKISKYDGLEDLYDWMYSTNLDCCIKEKYNKYNERFKS